MSYAIQMLALFSCVVTHGLGQENSDEMEALLGRMEEARQENPDEMEALLGTLEEALGGFSTDQLESLFHDLNEEGADPSSGINTVAALPGAMSALSRSPTAQKILAGATMVTGGSASISTSTTTSTEDDKWKMILRGLGSPSNEEDDKFAGLEDTPEDSAGDEMDGLIGRMSDFSSRVDAAQNSKSEEAINARFFAGLDDDEDEEASEDGDLASQISQMLETGKVPKNIAQLLKKQEAAEPLDVAGGLEDGPAVPKKEPVYKDPPAVITSYGDIAGSKDSTDENPIVLLSRFNFQENVMSGREDQVEHWMIRFCHDWYSPCERILPAYKELAWKTEKKLNQDGLRTTVRFADIDCSTDKPLCNEQNAESYPKIIHYQKGKYVGEWEGNSGKEKDQLEMNKWMNKKAEKILQAKIEESQGASSKDAMTTVTELMTQENISLVWSVLGVVVTLLAHTWLVRSRPHGPPAKKEGDESSKGLKKAKTRVDSPGPSGLGSMLPEEWITNGSGKQLIEL